MARKAAARRPLGLRARLQRAAHHWTAGLGPGIVTGAADDDPSGIATYSQAGAQFGYGLLWTMLLTYPLMSAVQLVSAHIGRVTGAGLARNLGRAFPKRVVGVLIAILLMANIINIGADLSAMAASAQLVAGGGEHLFVIGFALLCVILQLFVPYRQYTAVLKWLTLSLFAYVGVVLLVARRVARSAARHGLADRSRAGGNAHHRRGLRDHDQPLFVLLAKLSGGRGNRGFAARQALEPNPARGDRRSFAESAPTPCSEWPSRTLSRWQSCSRRRRHSTPADITNINSAADAAEALRPVAGPFAFALFAIGIIGTGLLAVPVLAGSAAFAVSEVFGWKEGLEFQPRQAAGFYSIIVAATFMGILIDWSRIDPIKALFWSAVLERHLQPSRSWSR